MNNITKIATQLLCIASVDSTEKRVICVWYTIFSVSCDTGKMNETAPRQFLFCLFKRTFPLSLNILWNCRFSKFFWNHLNFLFFLYQKCAILPAVIIRKKRKWILYPYSIFHAKIWASFIFVLSIIPLHNSLTNFSDVNQVEQSTTCFFAGL